MSPNCYHVYSILHIVFVFLQFVSRAKLSRFVWLKLDESRIVDTAGKISAIEWMMSSVRCICVLYFTFYFRVCRYTCFKVALFLLCCTSVYIFQLSLFIAKLTILCLEIINKFFAGTVFDYHMLIIKYAYQPCDTGYMFGHHRLCDRPCSSLPFLSSYLALIM